MTREPESEGRRLTAVTAPTHGTDRAHETHDRLLVARFALGDALASDEAAAVRALLATCPGCTDLIAEMRLVQRATAASRAPARPRDFRLTPEQAATLRPGAWQRFLGRFSTPRVAVMRPLAGATLAIGIVVAGAGVALPRTGGDAPLATGDPGLTLQAPSEAVASPMTGQMIESGPAGSPASDHADGRRVDPKSSPNVSMMAVPSLPVGTDTDPEANRSPESAFVGGPSPESGDERGRTAGGTALMASDGDAGLPLLLMTLGILVAALSAAVLVLAWLARRATDPLLR